MPLLSLLGGGKLQKLEDTQHVVAGIVNFFERN
jgi:hypothetical protein